MTDRSTLNRRGMLRQMLGAAAAPTILTAVKGRAAPNARIQMGCIGIGNMGSGNTGAFAGRGQIQITAVCDVKKWVRDEWQNRVNQRYAAERNAGSYRGCNAYNDFREMLATEELDAVMIATPDHWHALIAHECAKAGCDIYCEKPLTLTVREADVLQAVVRRYDRVFQTGSQQRSSREFWQACMLVRNGYIGDITMVNVNIGPTATPMFYPTEPVPDGLDWDMWLGPAPWAPYNGERSSGNYGGGWRRVRDYSGGMMTDWGAHHFDITQWGLGMDGSGPVEVHPPGGDYERLTFVYANGTKAQHGGGGNGVLFQGTKGIVEVNRGYLRTEPERLAKITFAPSDVQLYESNDHHGNFLDCLRTRQRPICDVAVGASSVIMCHLGNIAYWTGRPFKWDPVTHELSDPEAARWLDRPRRSPWHLA